MKWTGSNMLSLHNIASARITKILHHYSNELYMTVNNRKLQKINVAQYNMMKVNP